MARMSLDTAIRLSAEVKGGGNIDRVKRSLQELARGGQTTAREMATLRSATFQFARANDNTVAGIRNSIAAFRGLQEQAKIGSREFRRYGTEIQQLEQRLRGLDGTAAAAGKSLGQQLATGLAAAGIGQALRGITMQAGRFDAELRKAAAIEGSAGAFGVLRKEIEAVAATAAGTPTEVAALATALSRAGFSAEETTQALAGIVRGAEATSISFEEMGSIAADNLRAFGLQTTETGRVVDVLTQTANKSNQTVLDLGESLKYAAPIARNLGVPLEDLAATMGLLANNGIRGSDAGTALRTGLTRLQIAASGSNEELEGLTRGNVLLAKAMRSLGAEIIDTQGNLLPLDQVILSLRENLQSMSTGRRAEIAKALFGDEAGSKFLALMNSSEEQIVKMFSQLRNAGGVAADTQQKMQGFDYSVKVLGGNIENVTNQIGGMIGVALKPLIDGLNELLSEAQKLPEPIKAIGAAAAAAGAVTLGFVAAIAALKAALAVIGGITAVTGALAAYKAAAVGATGAQIGLNLAVLANPWVALAAGITAATIALARWQSQSQKTGAAARTGDPAAMASARTRLSNVGQDISLLERQREGTTGRDRGSIDRRLASLRAQQRQLREDVRAGDRAAPPAAAQLSAAATAAGAVPPAAASAAGGGGGGGRGGSASKAARDAEREAEQINQQRQAADDLLRKEQNRLLILKAADPLQRQITEAIVKQSEIQEEYTRKLAASRSPEEERALKLARENALRVNSIELERSLAESSNSVLDPLKDAINAASDKLAYEREYGDLIAKGVNPELARQFIELDRIAAKSRENLELQIATLEAKAAELPITSEIRKELERQIELRKEQLKLIPGATDQAKGETAEEQKQRNERERRQKDADNAAERAKQLYRGIVNTIEDGIVGSIQAGLDSLIDGTKKLDQALKDIAAGVLKEISNQLLRFAVNLGMRAIFPGAFADGGVFTSGGVQAFASGGAFSNSIVSSPTIFRFADGGAMRTGLMGEAGPEAIMPLRRGPDGRLGVDASGLTVPFQRPTGAAAGAELEVPFQRTAAGLDVPFLKDGAAAAGSAAAGAATIDVRFETVRIGDLDVVTREEAQRIGRESAQRGAELAHKRYRNNPSARRAAGLA